MVLISFPFIYVKVLHYSLFYRDNFKDFLVWEILCSNILPLIERFVFLLLSLQNYLYSGFQSICRCFLSICDLSFSFNSLFQREVLNLWSLMIIAIVIVNLSVIRNLCLPQCHEDFLLCFFFLEPCIFRIYIYVNDPFFIWWKIWMQVFCFVLLLHIDTQFLQDNLFKTVSFLHWIAFASW